MEITANAIQTVNSGSNVQFTETPVQGNCSILHREGSGITTLRGLTRQCRARYRIFFNGNIAIPTGGTPGAISLAITINGEPAGSATMIATPAAVNEYFNISSSIYVDVPAGCCSQVSIQNNGLVPLSVQNANLIVERVA